MPPLEPPWPGAVAGGGVGDGAGVGAGLAAGGGGTGAPPSVGAGVGDDAGASERPHFPSFKLNMRENMRLSKSGIARGERLGISNIWDKIINCQDALARVAKIDRKISMPSPLWALTKTLSML